MIDFDIRIQRLWIFLNFLAFFVSIKPIDILLISGLSFKQMLLPSHGLKSCFQSRGKQSVSLINDLSLSLNKVFVHWGFQVILHFTHLFNFVIFIVEKHYKLPTNFQLCGVNSDKIRQCCLCFSGIKVGSQVFCNFLNVTRRFELLCVNTELKSVGISNCVLSLHVCLV